MSELAQRLIDHSHKFVPGDDNPFQDITSEQLNEFRAELLELRRHAAAIDVLERFLEETKATEWRHAIVKDAVMSGIKSSIARLRNEAAKR